MDERIGRKFLNAAFGFGGGCLPKDIRAFMAGPKSCSASAVSFLNGIDAINLRRRERRGRPDRRGAGRTALAGVRVAILGAAFKPESDDVRDSPALDVALRLDARYADVVVTDPRAMENARRKAPNLKFALSPEEAVNGAEVGAPAD
jgi:UDPglucose 6-dehydrogenase